jgi:hypothetical protein
MLQQLTLPPAAVLPPAATVGALVLGSGHVPEVQRVINDLDDFTAANMLPGDADLTALIPGYETYDATVLEFDVVPAKSGELVFQYIFASEGGDSVGTHAHKHHTAARHRRTAFPHWQACACARLLSGM